MPSSNPRRLGVFPEVDTASVDSAAAGVIAWGAAGAAPADGRLRWRWRGCLCEWLSRMRSLALSLLRHHKALHAYVLVVQVLLLLVLPLACCVTA